MVGATRSEDDGRILAAGGRRGEIYRALRELRQQCREQIATRFPHPGGDAC